MANELLPYLALLCRPGTAVDAGANIGHYSTALLAAPDCAVAAFEPFTETYLKLCQRMAAFGGGRFPPYFTAFNLALGAARAEATLAVPIVAQTVDHQAASLVKDFDKLAADAGFDGLETKSQPVAVVPLDSFGFAPVTFLKIDVEGAEMEVLRGAEQTIARSHPIIAIELEERHRLHSTIDAPAALDAMGYRGFFLLHGRLAPFDRFDRATMHVAPTLPMQTEGFSTPYINEFLFVHKDDNWGFARVRDGVGRVNSL